MIIQPGDVLVSNLHGELLSSTVWEHEDSIGTARLNSGDVCFVMSVVYGVNKIRDINLLLINHRSGCGWIRMPKEDIDDYFRHKAKTC